MPARKSITVTPRSDGGWAVVSGRSTLSTHRKKDTAVSAGRRQAKRQAPSRLTIKGNNGRIQDQRSYEASSRATSRRTSGTTRSTARGRAGSRTAKRTATKRAATSGRTQRSRRQTVAEIMTPNPRTLPMTASLREAAETMRTIDAGTVLVTDERDQLMGILTDRDIAIRAVAEGLDPLSTSVGDVSSPFPQTVSPGASVSDAVKLMRELNVRRLPVTEGDRPVGIVSLGDLAILQDPASTLADISAAPSTDRASGGTVLGQEQVVDVLMVEPGAVPPTEGDVFTRSRVPRR